MKTTIKIFQQFNYDVSVKTYQRKIEIVKNLTWLPKFVIIAIMMLLMVTDLYAQVSGNWDSYSSDGSAGYVNLGGGVINLLSDGTNTCAAAAVHETTNRYNTSSATTFSKCYQVF